MPVLRAKIDGTWIDIGGLGPPGPQGLQGIQGVPGPGVPNGGTTGQVLTKNSPTNLDASWQTPAAGAGSLPIGGTVGQVLTKTSSTNYATAWQTPGMPILPNNVALKSFQSNGSSISDLLKLDAANEVVLSTPRVPAIPALNIDGRVNIKPYSYADGNTYAQLYVVNDGSFGGNQKIAEVMFQGVNRATLVIRASDRVYSYLTRQLPLAGKTAALWLQQVHSDGSFIIGNTETETDFAFGLDLSKNAGFKGNVIITADKTFGTYSGKVIAMERSADGRILYAHNADAWFNEGSGVTRFNRGLQLADNNWIYSPNGIYMMSYEPATLRIHIGWNQNVQFNAAGGVCYFAQSIDVAGSIYKAGSPYNFPDYVFEHAYTGKVREYEDADGAHEYRGAIPLQELETYTKQFWRLPNHLREDSRVDVARRAHDLLAEVERIYLYLFDHERRLQRLQRYS